MTTRRNISYVTAAVLLAQLVLAEAAPQIAIIKSSSVLPFDQAMSAAVDAVRGDAPQPEILTFDLEGDETNSATVLAAVRDANPRLVITIGSLATAAVLKAPPAAPVLFSMVLYPRESGFLSASGAQVSGVSLDIPLAMQFEYLRRLFPVAHRVGVLYNRAETGALIDEAQRAAATSGLTLVAEPVDDPARAIATLDTLMDGVDVVWSVADSHVFTPQTTSAVILATLRHGVPLFGLSTAHVRAGAVAALYCDYTDIGRQTGEMALRVLHGERAGTIPVAPPRTVSLALNLRSARHLHLDIPPALEAEAREVIR
jgi:putative ABC transport system substrate-binding protein